MAILPTSILYILLTHVYFGGSDMAYYDCIQARTELNAWIRKQEVKGPPDVMFGKCR